MSSTSSNQPQADQFSTVQVTAAVERVKNSDHGPTGRLTIPLLSLPGLRLVLVSMRSAATWPEHSTAGRITVQPLAGEILMRASGTEISLHVGAVAAFAAGVTHDVVAVTDAVFLLTVARPDLA